MLPEWTGKAVGLMHVHGIKQGDLAKEIGWTRVYTNYCLNGRVSTSHTEKDVMSALNRLIKKRGG